MNTVLSITFIWACAEYCTAYETKTNNVSLKLSFAPTQIYLKYATMTKNALIEGNHRILIAVKIYDLTV